MWYIFLVTGEDRYYQNKDPSPTIIPADASHMGDTLNGININLPKTKEPSKEFDQPMLEFRQKHPLKMLR